MPCTEKVLAEVEQENKGIMTTSSPEIISIQFFFR